MFLKLRPIQSAFEQRFYATLASVIGPIVEENDRDTRGEAHWLRGSYRGQSLRVAVSHRQRGRNASRKGYLGSFAVHASLGGRPIDMTIQDRAGTVVMYRPEVRTGDALFDREFLVNGFPEAAIQALLDTPTRAGLLAHFRGRGSCIGIFDGELMIVGPPVDECRNFNQPDPPDLTPQAVAAFIEYVFDWTGRLARAFDQQRAHVAQQHGEAAAQRWVEGGFATLAQLAKVRRKWRWTIYLVIFVVMVVPFLVFMGLVLFFARC